jgi:mRNA interferase MazF
MKRGEVRWVTFKAPDKRRPVLILTRSSVIPYLTLVTVAPITTTIRNIGSEVLLTQEDGLLTDCVVNLDNIQTISQAELGELITMLSGIRMEEVDEAIKFALGINEKFY